jgi:hypothetical protein
MTDVHDPQRRGTGPVPDFALVRPFVEDARAGNRHRSVVTGEYLDATQEIPRTLAGPDDDPDEPPVVVNGRSLALPLILASAVVLAGGVVGVYVLTAWSNPGTMTMPQSPVVALPIESASTAAKASPSAAPVDTSQPESGTRTHPAVAPGSAPALPSPSPSMAFGAAAPTPSPTDPYSPLPTAPVTSIIIGIGGMCVDDRGRISDNGTAIQIYNCNGTPAQWYTFQPNATVQVLGKCIQPTKPAAGAVVELWDCTGDPIQTWRRGPANSIVNAESGLCLDDPGSSQTAATQLDIAACTGAPNQSWNVIH